MAASVMTLPQRWAIPFSVISPSFRLKVPRPAAWAACRSDHVEANPFLSSLTGRHIPEMSGATALIPMLLNRSTTYM